MNLSSITSVFYKRRPQTGFALPSAIFLLVVLALLAAFLIRITLSSDSTAQMDVQGSRAYHIAQAGIESQLYVLLSLAAQSNSALVAAANANSGVLPLASLPQTFPACPNTPSANLEGFTLSMACTRSAPFREETHRMIFTYALSASASQGVFGQEGYIEREIAADIALCRSALSVSSTIAPFACDP